MAVELRIPSAGESITEVQIGAWLKAEGDYVQRDEPIVEIETDKAAMELPAPVSGILTAQLKKTGEVVPVGSVIATIDPSPTAPEREAPSGASAARSGLKTPESAPVGSAPAAPGPAPRVMPVAQRAVARAGLDSAEAQATGPGGRPLQEEVQRPIAGASSDADLQSGPAVPTSPPTPAATAASDRPEEIVPMTMLRRRIAQRLVEAQHTMAMLTTFNEIDMSAVQRLRAERGEKFQKKYGVRLGVMSFFVKAAIDALRRVPQVNAEIRGTDIVFKNYYDIGVAVSTEQGLVVPVLRNADRLSFAQIELAIADLAARARERKITIDELQGGTFTITNGGVFGSLLATPIINPPQSAILGLHAIQDRPVARDGQVVIRPMMYVALTYDHRLIDGRESVTFLRRIVECVEDPARMLIEV